MNLARPFPPPVARPLIEFAQATDPGRDPNKQINEDACGYAETRFGHLIVLCDGMGGHYGGKEASRTAITTIFEVFEQLPPATAPREALQASIEEAARRVYRLGGPPENRTRPGSTVVALLLHDRLAEVAHVGDSRAHMLRAGQLYPITRDHSMLQGMIDAGVLTEEQAFGHPDANKITRALGMRPEVEVDVRPDALELFAGDVLLLSSDGLTDLAVASDILGTARQALANGPLSHACTCLVQLANDRGGHDNITVQMVRVLDVTPSSRGAVSPPSGAKPHVTLADAPPSGSSMRAAEMPPSAPLETRADTTPYAGGQPAWEGGVHPAEAAPPRLHPAETLPPRPQFLGTPQAPISVGPTATDVPPKVVAVAPPPLAPMPPRPPGPTMTEAMDPAQSWSSGMYTGPAPQRPAGAYGVEPSHPVAPPPPMSPTGHGGNGPPRGVEHPPFPFSPPPHPASMQPAPPSMQAPPIAMQAPAPLSMQAPPLPMPAALPLGMPPTPPMPAAPPARSGMVFVIIGLCAIIAVLLGLLLWSLFLRGT